MPRDRLIAGAIFLLGALALAGVYFSTRPGPAPVPAPAAQSGEDAPGLYLVIDVAGEANGTVTIDLLEKAAPGHVARVRALAEAGEYDNVVFHRVIDGFMAQTGDVEFGMMGDDLSKAGRGGSAMPDLGAEFSDIPFGRGVVGMARSQSPDSANSQFFIMFAPAPNLDGAYTVFGRVVEGMEVVDAIKRGTGSNGAVLGAPDRMSSVRITQTR